MTTIAQESQKAVRDAKISLFRLDATSVGGAVEYFCPGKIGDNPVSFGGQAYTPIDIEVTGFQSNSGGTLPTPTLRIANSDDYVQGLVNTYGDLAGCEVRRVVTFRRYLDDGSEPDATAYVGPDVFRVERKSDENPDYIEWELSAAIDQEGKQLPGEVVLRDTCPLRYRRYAPSDPAAAPDGFIYPTINPCPYTGDASFDINNNPTTPDADRCSRNLTGCKLRFGSDQPLPFGALPGVARVRL